MAATANSLPLGIAPPLQTFNFQQGGRGGGAEDTSEEPSQEDQCRPWGLCFEDVEYWCSLILLLSNPPSSTLLDQRRGDRKYRQERGCFLGRQGGWVALHCRAQPSTKLQWTSAFGVSVLVAPQSEISTISRRTTVFS